MKPLIVKLEKSNIPSSITTAKKRFSPIKFVIISYLIVILAGAFLLAQPFASRANQRTNFIDSLFTSTSAVAVTGLVVKDTSTYWSGIGQLIILILIQIGGLGYITIFTFFFFIFQRKLTLKHELFLQETLNQPTIMEIAKLAKRIFFFVVIFEGIGAIILFFRFLNPFKTANMTFGGIVDSAWKGVFHSLAAFNNAGFDLTGNFKSLTGYVSDPIINITVTSLVIIGGIGFYVLHDLHQKYRGIKPHLSFHSRIAIFTTLFLIITGTILIFALEYNNPKTLGQLNLPAKIMASYFQSVTSRTAGFSTISTSALTNASLLFIVVLMFIGASPGGTGGGIKTTTFTTIYNYIRSMIKRKDSVEIGYRRVPYEVVNKAVFIFIISIAFVFFMTLIISSIEQFYFVQLFFEVVSAYGTVGLSTGITPLLSPISKLLISFTMFTGRVGILSIVLLFSMRLERGKVLLPQEDLTVG